MEIDSSEPLGSMAFLSSVAFLAFRATAIPFRVCELRMTERGLDRMPSDTRLELERLPQVKARVGLSATTIWRLRRTGNFPVPVKIAPGSVAFVKDEIDAWIAARMADRDVA